MGIFCDFVKGASPTLPKLPFVHTCDAFYFRGIAQAERLQPRECNVFKGERLLYFFYGRPAYHTGGTDSVEKVAMQPVCIILKPDALASIKRIAPFDTGAYHSKLYQNHVHPGMLLDNFLLDSEVDMPAKVVATFFGSNIDYYDANPLASVSIPAINFEAVAYFDLISDRGTSVVDSRRSTIELQIDSEIPITKDTIELVVLPNSLFQVEQIRQKLSDWGVAIRTYTTFRGAPRSYSALMFEQVRAYFEEKQWL